MAEWKAADWRTRHPTDGMICVYAKTIAVAADRDFADLDDSWPLLAEALAGERIEASVVVWDDSAVDWSPFDLVLASYMWGYAPVAGAS